MTEIIQPINNRIFDGWTVIHAITGFLIGRFVPNRTIGYSAIVGFEVIENMDFIRDQLKDKEGRFNILSDIIVGLAAYELGRRKTNE